jgi:hypothetical protein
VLDSRTMQSTPESGVREGYNAGKRRKGTKVHLAVDTLGHQLAVHASAADEQDRAHLASLLGKVQNVNGGQCETGVRGLELYQRRCRQGGLHGGN